MRIQGEQKYVLLAGMTGFLLGICSANLWMKQYVLDIGILNQYFLEQYSVFVVSGKKQRNSVCAAFGCSRNALQENGSYADSGMAWILFWYGNLYGNHKIRKQRDRTHRYRTRTTGNLLCNGRDRVIPLYAGISNGEMGCGKKYPSWPVPDAGDHYRVLCKSGTYRLVFEDTVNIQKCRIKEPIHEKICFISCIGSFFVQKIS